MGNWVLLARATRAGRIPLEGSNYIRRSITLHAEWCRMSKERDKTSTPEFMRDPEERVLLHIIRSIIKAHPDKLKRSEENRVAIALSVLLGRELNRGAPNHYREDILVMAARFCSHEHNHYNVDGSFESYARMAIEHHPDIRDKAERNSIVRYVARKLKENYDELLNNYGYDMGNPDYDFQQSCIAIHKALNNAGIAIKRYPPQWDEWDPGEIPPI